MNQFRRIQNAFRSWGFRVYRGQTDSLVGSRGRYRIEVGFSRTEAGSPIYGVDLTQDGRSRQLRHLTGEDPVELVAVLVAWCYREGDLW